VWTGSTVILRCRAAVPWPVVFSAFCSLISQGCSALAPAHQLIIIAYPGSDPAYSLRRQPRSLAGRPPAVDCRHDGTSSRGLAQLAAVPCHMVVHDDDAVFGTLWLVIINTKIIRSMQKLRVLGLQVTRSLHTERLNAEYNA
jgi:hypothetical protein